MLCQHIFNVLLTSYKQTKKLSYLVVVFFALWITTIDFFALIVYNCHQRSKMKKLQIIIGSLVLAGAISAGSFVYANRETEQPKEEVKVEQASTPIVEQPVAQAAPIAEEKVETPVKTAEPVKETPKVESVPVVENKVEPINNTVDEPSEPIIETKPTCSSVEVIRQQKLADEGARYRAELGAYKEDMNDRWLFENSGVYQTGLEKIQQTHLFKLLEIEEWRKQQLCTK